MTQYSTEDIIVHNDKYYYFPTMTKNIMFIRDEKYICLSDRIGKMVKGRTYIVDDFINGNILSSIHFRDDEGVIYKVSPFDCGSFSSLKKQRKRKIERINEKVKNN